MWEVEKNSKLKNENNFSSSGNESHSFELFFACPKSLPSIFSIIFCTGKLFCTLTLAAVLLHLTTTSLTMLFFVPLTGKKRYIYVKNILYEPVGNRSDGISSALLSFLRSESAVVWFCARTDTSLHLLACIINPDPSIMFTDSANL